MVNSFPLTSGTISFLVLSILHADELSITVTSLLANLFAHFRDKSLPTENKPEDFFGAVGDFNISLNSNKNELKATESFQVELKISGSGNLKLFSIPDLIVPSSLEKYDPEYSESVKIGLAGMNGNISNISDGIFRNVKKIGSPIETFKSLKKLISSKIFSMKARVIKMKIDELIMTTYLI